MFHQLVLLAGDISTDTVTNTEIFGPIRAVFRVIGIGILFAGLYKAIRELAKGQTLDAGKAFAFGLIAALLCWDISAPLSILDGSGTLVTSITNSISDIMSGITE